MNQAISIPTTSARVENPLNEDNELPKYTELSQESLAIKALDCACRNRVHFTSVDVSDDEQLQIVESIVLLSSEDKDATLSSCVHVMGLSYGAFDILSRYTEAAYIADEGDESGEEMLELFEELLGRYVRSHQNKRSAVEIEVICAAPRVKRRQSSPRRAQS